MGKARSIDDYPAVLTTADLAELLHIPVKKARSMASEGRIPAHKPPGSHEWRFDRTKVIEWLRGKRG